ncbi:MAG: hypothetical protein KGK07_15620 [Chloroflexota bacterium]|nr:hypothetical protein [Chloroflexota bacterium]
MSDSRAPHAWRPGALLPCCGEVRGHVVFLRALLSGSGKRMCTVFEAVVPEELAGTYMAARGEPDRCPPPWGEGGRTG